MGRNVETKARLTNPTRTHQLAAEIAETAPEVIQQLDTFFNLSAGRLKLREFDAPPAQLILYQRPDQKSPGQSHYLIAEIPDPEVFVSEFGRIFGVRGVVSKTRTLYLSGTTRIHIDKVEQLGEYLELEVVLGPADTAEQGRTEAARLMGYLKIDPGQLIDVAYIDLLEALQR